MILAFVSNLALAPFSAFYQALFVAQVGFYAAALAGLRCGGAVLRVPSFLLVANVAVLAAWFRYARGERIIAWNPSERPNALPQSYAR
jgi:hypothetical protein